MAKITSLIPSLLCEKFRMLLPGVIHEISMADESQELPEVSITDQNISPDILEKKSGAVYPSLHIYCDRFENQLVEKFRIFSGIVNSVAEIRISHDYISALTAQEKILTEAVSAVLNQLRGDLDEGIFFGGVYNISFSPIKHGGKNYFQVIKISFPLNVSLD